MSMSFHVGPGINISELASTRKEDEDTLLFAAASELNPTDYADWKSADGIIDDGYLDTLLFDFCEAVGKSFGHDVFSYCEHRPSNSWLVYVSATAAYQKNADMHAAMKELTKRFGDDAKEVWFEHVCF